MPGMVLTQIKLLFMAHLIHKIYRIYTAALMEKIDQISLEAELRGVY